MESPEALVRRVEHNTRLDRLAEVYDRVGRLLPGSPEATNVLTGRWLGHPVHPMLTDVPIGAFTSSAFLDWLPGRWSRRPADLLLVAGLVAAAPTAVTGLRDWLDTTGTTRRVGAAHATANTSAVVLYTLSLVQRLRGRRGIGMVLALIGWLVLGVGGYLGGHLSYRRGVGVDENAFAPTVRDWTPTVGIDDLAQRTPTRVTAGGVDVLLYRDDGIVHAISNRCSHLGGPLDQGHVHATEGVVSCPWHHSSFRLRDGGVVRGPASHPQPAFETRIQDGMVEVRSVP